MLFQKCVLLKKNTLQWGQFQEVVRQMAIQRGQPYQELVHAASLGHLGQRGSSATFNAADTDGCFQNVGERYTHGSDGTPLSLDNFKILKVLGKGGYGKVQLVRARGTGELYAMKTLKKADLHKLKQVQHTQTECKVAMCLRNPFLVNLSFAFQTPVKLHLVSAE
jgi:hypothetical protein